MDSGKIRTTFLDFFKERQHKIVPSAPMVVKNDPSLLFTNAGMNPFKDFFIGNRKSPHSRIADTQKCLRVSGKHNDLEEVGVDTYHHTMFEMLGNWSFGDYFKEEAIQWAYELLVDVYKIDKDRLYVTCFSGDKKENLPEDKDCRELWKKYFDEDRILPFGKKDNFWEMGDTGPCGPCSEIHIDLREEVERKKNDGRKLVNRGDPLVIELWNLVFIEFNRQKSGELKPLPEKHVDTGMGLERLAMVLQGKKSNYDSDIFHPLIRTLEETLKTEYRHSSSKVDIAFRVMVDHVRAVSMAITEGQLPSNTGAGYVIRRVLRRAIRYAYSFLNVKEPIICTLVPALVGQLGNVFPELKSQSELVQNVIREEEENFLRTLEKGIERFEKYLEADKDRKEVEGKFAFELYDTYGFPLDLTELMAAEYNVERGVNRKAFDACLKEQKERSRSATKIDAGDWVVVKKDDVEEFVGWDRMEAKVFITRYRKVKQKNKEQYQLVFNITPFYAESGGQVGDRGEIEIESESESGSGRERVEIVDTRKEGDVIVHIADKIPGNLEAKFNAVVDKKRRIDTQRNHTATHLLHRALREVLGGHVEQKGSLVHPDYLRFDFSHFEKVKDEDLKTIQKKVNECIRKGIALDEKRSVPLDEARKMGAMALFGEKYGDMVRVIRYGESVELCGGTHVANTAEIGAFILTSETSISAGIRRIEAITGEAAEQHLQAQLEELEEVKSMLKNPRDLKQSLKKLMQENSQLKKEIAAVKANQVNVLSGELEKKIETQHGMEILFANVEFSLEDMRTLVFQKIKNHFDLVVVLYSVIKDKAYISIGVGEHLINDKGISADDLRKEISNEINGKGGGQNQYATATGNTFPDLHSRLENWMERFKKSLNSR